MFWWIAAKEAIIFDAQLSSFITVVTNKQSRATSGQKSWSWLKTPDDSHMRIRTGTNWTIYFHARGLVINHIWCIAYLHTYIVTSGTYFRQILQQIEYFFKFLARFILLCLLIKHIFFRKFIYFIWYNNTTIFKIYFYFFLCVFMCFKVATPPQRAIIYIFIE